MGGRPISTEYVTRLAMAARNGDHAAAESFVRATQADVWRLCAHLGDTAAADDLTQETYLRVFRALPRFAGRSSARTWLLSIARRVVADHIRALRRRPRLVASWDDDIETRARESEAASGRQEAVVLHALLDLLESKRREAFLLTQLLGLTYHEAAQVCGCPVGTIRSRVARARDDLINGLRADDRASNTR